MRRFFSVSRSVKLRIVGEDQAKTRTGPVLPRPAAGRRSHQGRVAIRLGWAVHWMVDDRQECRCSLIEQVELGRIGVGHMLGPRVLRLGAALFGVGLGAVHFQVGENVLGAGDDGLGQVGEACDLDAVGFVGGAFDDLAQEDDLESEGAVLEMRRWDNEAVSLRPFRARVSGRQATPG